MKLNPLVHVFPYLLIGLTTMQQDCLMIRHQAIRLQRKMWIRILICMVS